MAKAIDWINLTSAQLWEMLSDIDKEVIDHLPPTDSTLGPEVCRWITAAAFLGEGDSYGKRVVLRPFQAAFLWRLYEIYPVDHEEAGRKVVKTAVYGIAKGGGKTPMEAWVSSFEMVGKCICVGFNDDGSPIPGLRMSPSIIQLAKNYDQAGLVFNETKATFENNEKLNPHVDSWVATIQLKSRPGKIERAYSTRGANDGERPTLVCVDEGHELTTAEQDGALTVLTNGLAKREDTFLLMGSTAGANMDTQLGKLYQLGMRMRKGEAEPDPSFLFVWYEADADLDPKNEEDVKKGIRQANPLYTEAQVKRTALAFMTKKLHEALRYYHNRWVQSGDAFIQEHTWNSIYLEPALWIDNPLLPTWFGIDLAKKQDTAAVVKVQRREDGRMQSTALKIWHADGGIIDHKEIAELVVAEAKICNTQKVCVDPMFFPDTLALLDKRLPGKVVAVYQNSRAMSEAVSMAYYAITSGTLAHDNNPAFTDQVLAAVNKDTAHGTKIEKNKAHPHRKIDAAVALCLACLYAYEPAKKKKVRQVF